MTYAEIVTYTVGALSDPPESWVTLAEQLQQLYAAGNRGRTVTVPVRRSVFARATARAEAHYNNKDEAFLAVTCTDTNNPRDPFRWPGVAARADRRFGPFGSFWAYLSEPCSAWPARDHDRYTGRYTRRTSAPILVVGTRFDPASPYENAVAVARELPRSRLLTLDGWGHVAFGKSACIAHLHRALPVEWSAATARNRVPARPAAVRVTRRGPETDGSGAPNSKLSCHDAPS